MYDDGVPYRAQGLPLPIVDADPTGVEAVVDGTDVVQDTGPEFTTNDGSALSVTLALDHSYHGDLSVRVGVADGAGDILCSVSVLDPDPSDASSGPLEGDVAVEECGGYYPPSSDQRWFLAVADLAAVDEGTVEAFAISGPDGGSYEFARLPIAVPDDDVDGVVLLLDGSTGTQGQVGGLGQSTDVPLPVVALDVAHTYAGDLLITAGVLDPAGEVTCEVTLDTPDASDATQDLSLRASVAECEELYPPSPDRRWFVHVIDTLSVDEGTIEALSLTGPDGVTSVSPDVGVTIPDADPDGVVVIFDGDEEQASPEVPVVNVLVTHSYAGDLDVTVGVLDAGGEVLCSLVVAESDIDNADVDLVVAASVPECADHYPPGPDRQWFVSVSDEFEIDVGTIDAFTVTGPDGTVREATGTPVPIPDADPAGATAVIDS